MDFFTAFGQVILSVPWVKIYEFIKYLLIFLDILIFVGLVLVAMRAWPYRPQFVHNPKVLKRRAIFKNPGLAKRWKNIREKARVNPPQSFILAIIDADKFTDDVLKQLGLRGEHMADRLERLSSEDLKTLDKLWRVHKIRNDLVHTPDYEIKPHNANEILDTYEAFLKEIEIL